jgi:phosphate transport system protein
MDEQLKELDRELIEMGALVERAITKAGKALEELDGKAAHEVIVDDQRIDDKEKAIESLCLKLLLTQQPVARDLRKVSTALKMITDLERIGDQAADICELCGYLGELAQAKGTLLIRSMARATGRMVTASIDAFVNRDIATAEAVIAADDEVDALFAQTRRELIELIARCPGCGEEVVDLLQVAKYYERIGDHAENIAEWVIFSLTGRHKDKQVL